ncbi:hypothetical protein GCM10010344_70820 [Streptomyces bluensis]|nr:hypothetical protein GCM10010344_70820 [Streptomyces bluensis]
MSVDEGGASFGGQHRIAQCGAGACGPTACPYCSSRASSFITSGKNKGHHPSVATIYRILAEADAADGIEKPVRKPPRWHGGTPPGRFRSA